MGIFLTRMNQVRQSVLRPFNFFKSFIFVPSVFANTYPALNYVKYDTCGKIK